MGVYSSDSIAKYINFCDIIKEKRAKYAFAIFDTDRENKPGNAFVELSWYLSKKRLSIIW